MSSSGTPTTTTTPSLLGAGKHAFGNRKPTTPIRYPSGRHHRSVSPNHRYDGGHRGRERGTSPFARAMKSTFGRSRSRHRSHSRDHNGTSSNNNIGPDELVVHTSARSLVFRDYVRRAQKIVEEEEDDEQEDNEDDSSDDDDSDDGATAYANLKASLRTSIRQSLNDSNNIVNTELDKLAHAIVPDLKDTQHVTLDHNVQLEEELDGGPRVVQPLPQLDWNPDTAYAPLVDQDVTNTSDWSVAEHEVYAALQTQHACVKTIQNEEWPSFLKRFLEPKNAQATVGRIANPHHVDHPKKEEDGFPFGSFMTSTSLLPECGKKMRCYGSTHAYTVGVVFLLPNATTYMPSHPATEQAVCSVTEAHDAQKSQTWAWPAGYAAKSEFNIDHRGRLIHGREEALVTLQQLRDYNHQYVYEQDHYIAGKMIQGGFHVVPYNEVYLRVGGRTRIVAEQDVVTGQDRVDDLGTGRSFDTGVGLPAALFIRTNTMADILRLLRTRARMEHIWGESHVRDIPLLYLHNEHGTRVFTESMQQAFMKMISSHLNPFQNPSLQAALSRDDNRNGIKEASTQQHVDELLDFHDAHLRQALTPEECARIAGGWGATDDSLATLLHDALLLDQTEQQQRSTKKKKKHASPHHLQDCVNEGLASAVRSGDFMTARQLLILYSVVASERHTQDFEETTAQLHDQASTYSDAHILTQELKAGLSTSDTEKPVVPPPPPPPLDTDRLLRATNSDGLLSVLGAAQILKVLQDGSARKRTVESYKAVEEWIEYGEQSVAFRLASWRDQRAAEDETGIAVDKDSKMMAFVSGKAISNRRRFAKQLRAAVSDGRNKDGQADNVHFLHDMYQLVQAMHSPCLRLELLQYIFGLDNRFSVAHVRRSMELAATCLSVAA